MAFEVREGKLFRDGRPFLVLGVNYHPTKVGCRIWVDWDPAAIAADFSRIAAAGLNTVRIFIFWRDFEPKRGCIDKVMLTRLREVVTTAQDAGLCCVLSLFTIWMNGRLLDVPWRRGRSLWRDGEVLAAEEEFSRAVARTVADCTNVLAMDIGDEISNVDITEAESLSPCEVAAWYEHIGNAIREEAAGLLVCQANNALTVFGSSSFGPASSAALDIIAVHGFPTWAPGEIESTLSFKATNLTSSLVRFSGAYGLPLVDEIGSYAVDEDVGAAYLRAAGASAIANGAAGLMVWCWQDIASTDEPYSQRPAERFAGLHRLDGTPKPAMAAYRRIAEAGRALMPDNRRASVALYVPESMHENGRSYLDGNSGAVATFFAYLLLKRAHLEFDVVVGDPVGYDLVICPSIDQITLPDIERIRGILDRGGTVYYSLGDHLHGFPGEPLVGAVIVDYTRDRREEPGIGWGRDLWRIDWRVARALPTTLRPTSGRVLGTYPDRTPALLCNDVGNGRLIFTNAPFERQLNQAGRLADGSWERFYRRVAAVAGVFPPIDCSDPEVEVVVKDGGVILINHRDRPVHVQVARHGASLDAGLCVGIEEKGWTIVDLPEDGAR